MNYPLQHQINSLFTRIFGQLSWIAPPWLRYLKQLYQRMGWWFWLLMIILGACIATYCYYQQLPKPLQVIANIRQPALTADKKNAKPDNLQIAFEYDLESLNADQARPKGKPSVARIDLLKQPLLTGIKLKPALAGRWIWRNDRHLQFTPDNDWPAGVEYTVLLDKSLFSKDTLLASDTYRFTTRAFASKLDELKFYQDPQDTAIKKVVATLSFSHPVDPGTLQKQLKLAMRPSGSGVDKLPKPYTFTLKYSKNHRKAYLHSKSISLPPQSNYMQFKLAEGVKSGLGGLASKQSLSKKVLIPDAGSFLQIEHSSTQIIKNEQGEPEQVLRLGFTDTIAASEVSTKLHAYLLPTYKNGDIKHWGSVQKISDQVLSRSEQIPLELIPNPRDSSRIYHFRYDVPEGRYLYLRIDPQLKSVNGYYRKAFYDQILTTPNYPKQVKIMGEGATLYRSGEHKLSLLTRGVEHLKISIGKVKHEQMYHLISQTSGEISKPDFHDSYHFSENNLAEFKQQIIPLKKTHPKTANYASFDLSGYLTDSGGKFGLFMIETKAWDVEHNRVIHSNDDKRLILVTDLGLLVKNNADGSHEVFVQSFVTGKPIQGANIQLLGVNGQAILNGQSDSEGHLHLPTTNDYKNEQQPTVYLVTTADDTAFIPFQRASRQLQYSSFDIGGVTADNQLADQLSAFVFSDRGIYRPGETVKLGGIVRQGYSAPADAIPLELVIRGPRSNQLKSKKFALPEQGLLEHELPTIASSNTGRYEVALHLITDKGRRGNLIGSATFRVEEFQPDTLKMESQIVGADHSGWVTAKDLQAKIKLENLFGTPAQNRKISAKMQVHPTRFQFKAFSDYTFYSAPVNSKLNTLQINETLPDTKTDVDGLASYQLDLQRFEQGNYVLNFHAEGFDVAGGRSVSAHNRVLISPLTYQVAYKADGALDYIHHKAKRSIELITINPQLEPIEKTGLSTRLQEIRQLSTLVKQDDGTFKYQTVASEKLIENKQLSLGKQSNKLLLPTAKAGEFALEIVDQSGNILNRVPFTVVGQGNLTANLEKNSLLKLKLNRKDYKAGDLIEMNITAPYQGSGLISIESDRVHTYKWFSSDSQSSLQSIRVPDDLEGNAYVNVAFIRSQHSKEIYSSPLSYAVQPFSIDRSQRVIDVQLDTPEKVIPGEVMEIGYQSSHASKLLIFAVDEGILQVAGYQTPAPLDHFLRKSALSVTSLQTLDLILPEFSQMQTDSVLSAPGGGAAEKKALAKNLNPFQRKTDKPAVFWSGIVDADSTQQVTRFTVPDSFAGSLRIMAVAVSSEAIGASHSNTLIRGHFVISPNLLTQAAPDDEFSLTVGIANNIENSGNNAPVSIAIETSEHLKVMGEAKQNLSISEKAEAQVSYRLKVNKQLGVASIKIIATGKGTSGVVSGQRTASLSVRPATPYFSSFSSGFAKDGTAQETIKRQLYTNLAQQKVAASASPLVLVDGLSSYLRHFPHGCTEQVVSKLFPALGLMNHPAFAVDKHKHRDKFVVLMDRLGARQQSDGGFSFWPGNSKVSEYPSIYALHFLLEAQELGIAVPGRLFQRGIQFLKRYAAKQTSTLAEARARANAIYLLTRSGQVTTNFLVQLQTSLQKRYPKQWQSDLAAVYMAAAYQLLHKDDEAQDLIQQYAMGGGATAHDDDFHTPLARDAQYLYIMARHFSTLLDDVDAKQIHQLITPIYHGEYNTISAAYSVLALGAYSQQKQAQQGEEVISFSANKADGSKIRLSANTQPFPNAEFAAGMQPEIIQLNIAAQQAMFYLVSQSGFDLQPAQQAISQGLEIHRAYLDEDGKEVTAYQIGKELTVRLRIRSLDNEFINNVAVIDLLPGGFEVVRKSISNSALQGQADYIDVREDRVVIYAGFSSSITELSYRVKVTAEGRFIIPPAFAESMYDRAIHANSAAGVFNVSKP